MKNFVFKYYPFLPLLLLCVFYGYKAIGFPIHDFSNYYFSGRFLAEGNFNSRIYFPYEFNKAISDLGHEHIFASYAPNTPFLAFLFVPFSFIPVEAAKLVFNCISIVLLLYSIYRLFSFYSINPKFALLVPVLFLVPIKNNLLFGQVYFLLFFLLAEGWIAYEQERWKQMAIFWSLAILLKVFPIFLLVFLIFKKKEIPVFFLIGFGLLFFGISTFFTGIDIWGFYLTEVLPKASNGEIASAFVPNYQSVFMFLKELLVFDAADNPEAIFNYPILFSALILAFKVGILTLGFFVSRRKYDVIFVFSYWILAMILCSPYGSTYTFLLLLVPFLALIKSDISNVKKGIFCLIVFLISNIPLSIFINKDFPFSYLRLYVLLLFFVLLLIQLRQRIYWKAVTVSVFLSMVFVLIFKKQEVVTSKPLFQKAPILIYDYQVSHNQLTYFYWDEKGGHKNTIAFKNATVSELDVSQRKMVSKSELLPLEHGNKYQPMLIDNKTLIYLSDYGRGIGFYTLRVIELKESI